MKIYTVSLGKPYERIVCQTRGKGAHTMAREYVAKMTETFRDVAYVHSGIAWMEERKIRDHPDNSKNRMIELAEADVKPFKFTRRPAARKGT